MDIHPIKTEVDYQAALAEIGRLFAAMPDTLAGDRLDVLATLVEAYEEQHYSLPAPDPIEAITYHMESRGLSRRDLEPYLGSRARVTEVLNRKRRLSLDMIRRLHTGLGIGAEILIQPYPLATRAPNPYEDPRCQETDAPQERIVPIFSAVLEAQRRPPLATCAVSIAVCWCTHVTAPHTY